MRIQHNITAMNSYRNYTQNANKLSKNLEKLSSGYKINRAGDDAAGLAISEKMRSQITGLNAAQKNVKDGISLVKTAEGALQEVHDMLNRMTYLATQSANGTYDGEVDRPNLQKELDALRTEIDRIADSSNFNGQKLLDGTLASTFSLGAVDSAIGADKGISAIDVSNLVAAHELAGDVSESASKLTLTYASDTDLLTMTYTADNAPTTVAKTETIKIAPPADGTESTVTFSNGLKLTLNAALAAISSTAIIATKADTGALKLQIGDTNEDFNQLSVQIGSMKAAALGIGAVDIATQAGAQTAIESIKNAIDTVSETRGQLGAYQNRLEHTNNNLAVMEENIQDAESTIRDTDVADEMTAYTKNNILLQSAQAMLAQANQMPQGVLQLLG